HRYVGGGSLVALDRAPRSGRVAVAIWNWMSRRWGWAAGSFLFCQSAAFVDLGGFSEALYAGEEIDFSRRLKRWGKAQKPRRLRMRILDRQPHISSGRKFDLYSPREIAWHAARCCLTPWVLRSSRHLGFYYEGRR
ncbi:MAG: glycosyl transferase, partial [Planctomycetota bacterium]